MRESDGTAVSEMLRSTCKGRFSCLFSIQKKGKNDETVFPVCTPSSIAINYCGLLHLLTTK